MKDDQFRPRAYERAARLIESMEDDLEDIYKKSGVKGLMEIEGVGKGMAEHIEEFLKTGKIRKFEQLKKQAPIDLESFSAVEGVGPKMLMALYKNLGVKNIRDLEKAARRGQVRTLPRFGEKTEENILRSIELSREHRGRFLLGYVSPIVSKIDRDLASVPGVKKSIACGSFRRRMETIGDIDLLAVSSRPREISEYFASMPNVERVIAKGETKSMVRLDIGADADLRVVLEKSFGAALQYFTGSKDHNVELRKIAIKKGWKLNEYGLFDKKGKQIAGRTEEEIYKKLGLDWMPPEMRENTGEIELAREHKLPKIVEYGEVISDLQMHTTYSDGAHTIEEMAEVAQKLGRKYIAITDHVGHLKIAGAMDTKTIERQWREIEKINKKLKNIKILKGCEVDINPDGTIALEDKYLAKFDVVLGSIHSNFKMSRTEMTKRLVRAMENDYLDELKEKVLNCFIGAATATGARLEYRWAEVRYDSLRNNLPLAQLFINNMQSLGREMPLTSPGTAFGSTDMGNVSQLVPSIHPFVAIASKEVLIHSKEFASAAASDRGMKGMLDAAKAMAMTAADLLADSDTLAKVKEEFEKGK